MELTRAATGQRSSEAAGGLPGRRRVAVIVGSRAELIKLAPVIQELDVVFGEGAAFVVHTGQRHDSSMTDRLWAELRLSGPAVRLDGRRKTRAACLGYLTAELGRLFAVCRPAAVVVHGDTDSAIAGAIAANAEGVLLVHTEAGLRSHDRAMPQEQNRIVADHLADLCCAATEANASNLRREGIAGAAIVVTGNTVVDAVQTHLPRRRHRRLLLSECGLTPNHYILTTLHRPENINDAGTLRQILSALVELTVLMQIPVVLPMNPRTRDAAKRADCEHMLQWLHVCEPIGSADFLALAAHAAVLVSDSGEVAEEATVLKRPLVMVQAATEREEAIEAGFAQLVHPQQIAPAVLAVLADQPNELSRLAGLVSPYGDGHAAKRVAHATQQLIYRTAVTG